MTFHLADSLPASAVERVVEDLHDLPPERLAIERRKRLDAWIDAGHGSCPLRQPALAEMMQSALLHGDGVRYRLLAWVVMPNHVHALCEPILGWSLPRIVASWKSFSGRRLSAAGADRATGHVWHREYWDRYIRDEGHLVTTVAYIHQNPVSAGLVESAGEWAWSSAAGLQG